MCESGVRSSCETSEMMFALSCSTSRCGRRSRKTSHGPLDLASQVFDRRDKVLDWNLLLGREYQSDFPPRLHHFGRVTLQHRVPALIPQWKDGGGRLTERGVGRPRSPRLVQANDVARCVGGEDDVAQAVEDGFEAGALDLGPGEAVSVLDGNRGLPGENLQ